jgi:hypothetical protein
MKFVALNGYVEEGSSFISIQIEGGDNSNSVGDQVWISNDGTEMEILEHADSDILQDTMYLFEGNSRRAFRGALMRMGVEF